MSIWAMGAILGPIVGPALGGWLTDNLSWRWVFFINLPIGAIAFFGISTFLRGEGEPRTVKLDFTGFAMLGIALGSFQIMLDRGQQLDWFSRARSGSRRGSPRSSSTSSSYRPSPRGSPSSIRACSPIAISSPAR
jgi:MFS family permease